MERKRRFQTRQQYAEQKAQDTKFDKLNKNLSVLIAVVAVAIVATLTILISGDPKPKEKAESQAKEEQVASQDQQSSSEESNTTTTEDNEGDVEDSEQSSTEAADNTILASADPIVDEVLVNKGWAAFPTEQTGTHESTYVKGHIDYEEKLKAIFSVLDIPQDKSIVLSVKNNGSTTTSIAVVTSMDKEQKYRVSIEWIDGEGWKPTRLEVLNTVEGAY